MSRNRAFLTCPIQVPKETITGWVIVACGKGATHGHSRFCQEHWAELEESAEALVRHLRGYYRRRPMGRSESYLAVVGQAVGHLERRAMLRREGAI